MVAAVAAAAAVGAAQPAAPGMQQVFNSAATALSSSLAGQVQSLITTTLLPGSSVALTAVPEGVGVTVALGTNARRVKPQGMTARTCR